VGLDRQRRRCRPGGHPAGAPGQCGYGVPGAPGGAAPPVADVRVVGIDEWALRQRRTYATIVVNPERHPGVDVWPDDQPETVAAWRRAHPTIRLVTRDRDERLARAIAAGAPTALPVSDRFHLLQHRRQVLERVFAPHGIGPGRSAVAPVEPPGPASPPPTAAAQRRQDLGTRIHERVAAGESLRAMAQQLTRDRATVRQ
jgi:hypothetical protein